MNPLKKIPQVKGSHQLTAGLELAQDDKYMLPRAFMTLSSSHCKYLTHVSPPHKALTWLMLLQH